MYGSPVLWNDSTVSTGLYRQDRFDRIVSAGSFRQDCIDRIVSIRGATGMKLFFLKAAASTAASRILAVLTTFKPFSDRVSGRIYFRIPALERTLYLTFDDGPGPATQPLIDYLNLKQARATFFFTGEATESCRESASVLTAARLSGHEVGLHGYRHLNAWHHRASTIEDDHDRGLRRLLAPGNADAEITTTWARPPYGRLTRSLYAWYKRNSLAVALWDVDPADYSDGVTAADVIRYIRKTVRSGSLVLLHENSPVWAEENGTSLDRLIDGLIADGWKLEALPHPREVFPDALEALPHPREVFPDPEKRP